jgi:hypothetical protein
VSVFADTSAFYALLVGSEDAHDAVRAAFADIVGAGRPLWTTSFVIVETLAILQHRIGLNAARDFDDVVVPVLRIQWVDERLYRLGVDRLWREDRRRSALWTASASSSWSIRGSRRLSPWIPISRPPDLPCCPGDPGRGVRRVVTATSHGRVAARP